ncbi:hypothetical protein F5878DRAFT_547295 [Lentinula raphanica]|uniref:Uncharacterized protein n=1 Tax=Lentinula raphanica TaxID=153919 RepID=A0AA38NYT3_9AGAR|nr:hypothetical protein F5880DRAFT_1490492 [Lentinula raphanica]KAJ3833016.1 hypothetical protein F5878DRAFT_547295 [Lentinula raphanica]
MLQELPTLLPSTATAGTEYQIRCFGHILNLCVKAFLFLFDTSEKAVKADTTPAENVDGDSSEDEDEGEEVDNDQLEENEEAERDNGDWDEIAKLSTAIDEVLELSKEEIVVGCCTIKKLRKLGKKIRNSSVLQSELAEACKSEHIQVKQMIRPIDICWNTLCDVIERALDLRRALEHLLSQGKHKLGKKPLAAWRLTSEEWKLLDDILPMFKVFCQATKRLLASGRPLVADVISVINLINQQLESLVNDMTKPAIVQASAAKGRAVLNKYYSKMDDSKMYRICMSKCLIKSQTSFTNFIG